MKEIKYIREGLRLFLAEFDIYEGIDEMSIEEMIEILEYFDKTTGPIIQGLFILKIVSWAARFEKSFRGEKFPGPGAGRNWKPVFPRNHPGAFTQ